MSKKSGIHIKKSKQGSLHKALGVPKGEKIPASKLKIKSTDSPAMKKKKQFAINAKKFKHQTGGYQPEQVPLPGGPFDPSFGEDNQDPSELMHQYMAQHPVEQGLEGGPQPQTQSQPQPQPAAPKSDWRATGRDVLGYVNAGATAVTAIANSINEKKLREDERRRILKSVTPRFMENKESEGLNNMPAYTMYGGEKKMGGPIKYGEPVGIVDSNPGSGLDESMYEGFRNDAFYGQNQIYSGEQSQQYMMGGEYKDGGNVSSAKAKEILKDGTVHGHPLTDKQKRYFGWIAGGAKQTGGPVPHYHFAEGVQPNALDSASYNHDFYDAVYGNPKALEHIQDMNQPGQLPSRAVTENPTSKELAYIDALNQSNVRKPIKIKKQAGGSTPPAVDPSSFQGVQGATADSVQQASAYVNQFRPALSEALRKKNPQAFSSVDDQLTQLAQEYKTNYTKLIGDKSPPEERTAKLQQASKDYQAKRQQAIQSANITDYLDPNAIKTTLGSNYDTYIKNQQVIANYNKSKGTGIVGTKEDPNAAAANINFGYRSLYEQGNTGGGYSVTSGDKTGMTQQSGNAQYEIDPNTGKPVKKVVTQTKFVPTNGTRQNGGYALGSEYNLTKAQIKQLKANGYDFEEC